MKTQIEKGSLTKRVLKFLGLAAFCGLFSAANAETTALVGLGTAADPYQLGSVDDLRFMANAINGKAAAPSGGTAYYIAHYVLTADIDFAGVTDWPQIATSTMEGINFQGVLDGAGKRILNFHYGYKANGAGFFYTMQGGAVVKNLTFDGASVGDRNSGNQCGIVSGYAYGTVTFENVTITNSAVKAYGKVAPILGQAADAGGTTTFRNCRVVDTTVRGAYNCGGLCGLSLNNCVVENCDTKGVEFSMADSVSKYVALDTVARNGDKAQRVTGLFWKYPYGNITYYYAGWGDYYCDYKYEGWTLDAPANSYLADGLPHDIEVAEVVDVAGAATRYRTLAEAVANVKAGWTVTLLVNCEESVSAPALPFTFEGNGFAGTIAPAEGYKLVASPIAGDTSVRHVAEDDDSALSASWIKIASGFYADGSSYDLSSNYYITSKEGLKYFADVVNGSVADFYPTGTNPFGGKTVHLLSDIDLNNEEWTPIGFDYQQGKKQSYAAFDGGSRMISNLKVTKFQTAEAKKYGVGLFGRVGDASSFRDLAFCNVTLRGYEYVAALFGQAAKTVRVENVRVTGEIAIEASRFSGIVAGHASGKCEFVGCAVDADGSIRTSATTGGIIGYGGQAAGCLVADCLVKDVTVDASGSTATSVRCGAVAGEFYQGLITNCAVRGVTVAAAADKLRVGGIVGGSGVTDLVVVDCLTDGETTVQGKSEFTQSGDLSSENLIVGWNIVWTEESKVNGGVFECLADSRVGAGYCKRARGTAPETWKVVPCEIQPAPEQETTVEEKVVDENGKELAEGDLTPEQKAAVVEAVAETKQKVAESLVADPVVAGADTKMGETIAENRDLVVESLVGAAQELGVNVDEVKGQIEEKIEKLAAGEPTEDTSKYLSINIGKVNAKVVVGEGVNATPEKLRYEVTPFVKTEVTSVVGGTEVKTVLETTLSNEAVRKNPITFVLEVFDPKATRAMVKHTSDDPAFGVEVFSCPIWSEGGKRYITITASHFSEFEITYSSEIAVETAETVGILKIEKDGTDVVAAAVPFAAESFDALVTTGAQAGDTVAGASNDIGAPFWYARASDNGVPLTFAGLVDTIPATQVEQGTSAAPIATLLVNPNRTTANLLAELSEGAAEGDEIALAGGDVRYVFDGENWTLVTKGNKSDETDEAVYGDDTVTPVTSVLVGGSRAAWYVSKGGAPTVTWADGSVGAEFVNGAEGAMTYAAADWAYEKTPFENDTFNHAYVRFSCDAGGITFGGDKTGNKTTFLGADGFDWTSRDPLASVFRVALLNGNRDVIAVSRTMTFDDLKAANALDLNYTGNVAPVAATAKATFGGFTVPDAGEYDALTNAFKGVATVSVDRDADGNFVYTVKLSSDVTGPVALADNLGQVVLDLNGHSVTGLAATVSSDAGNAIVIAGSLADAANATALLVKNTSLVGAKVVGGNGADGVTTKPGAAAIAYDPATVTVTDPDGLVSAGANGVSATAWAWCTCATAPAEIPYGVSYEESTGKCLFWRNNDGKAAFDFGEVKGWDITDRKIYFYSQVGGIDVQLLYVPSDAGDLTFVGEEGATLVGTGVDRTFVVDAGTAQVVAWTNLTFSGAGIAMTHGSFDIQDCTFYGCVGGQYGGAVDAQLLDGDSTIADSVFANNCSDFANFANSDGGAVFATASAAGTKLVISGTEFTENRAANGGAISTQTRGVGGKPVALVIADSTFTGNAAATGCSGGAIAAGGDVFVDVGATAEEPGTTVFLDNLAGLSGGAIELGYSVDREDGAEASDALLSIGRGVQFVGNVASNEEFYALGGAICVEEPPEGYAFGVAATGVLFRANAAVTPSDWGAQGGAVMTWSNATVSVDTCVFDGNVARSAPYQNLVTCAGGALLLLSADAEIRNSTFRNSNIEAVYAAYGTLDVDNCVAVGNDLEGIAGSGDIDLVLYPTAAADYAVNYSAFGSVAGDFADGGHNLTNRTTAIYDGDSLKLNPVGFNPVAVFGRVQPGAQDFEGVAYGIDSCWSMGAYEAVTVKLTVTVTGDRDYNGETTTNGIEQFVFVLSTNGVEVAAEDVCPDLGEVTNLFTVTDWAFDAEHVGYYASTNAPGARVTASLSGLEDFRDAFVFVYEGTISPADDGLEIVIDPLEYEWTGDEVVPASVTVIDHFTREELAEGVDYVLTVSDNRDPTASAKVKVDGLYNFRGASSTSNFWITAYYVKHSFDGVVRDEYTEIHGALGGSNAVAQALADVPEGYCFDWQNSVTNGAVRTFDAEGGLLTIEVQYRTDSNGDGVPDGFQKRITAMVVNGEWNDAALSGVNQDVWVTLVNADGKWDYAGTGKLVAGDGYADHNLPAAGNAPDGKSQKKGGWIAYNSSTRRFEVVGDADAATNVVISASTVPVFLYGYLAKAAPSLPGRGGRTPTLADLAAQYGLDVTIEALSVDANIVTLGAKVKLVKQGAAMADIPLDGTQIRVRTLSALGAAPETDELVKPDSEGNVKIRKPAGDQAFFQIGL